MISHATFAHLARMNIVLTPEQYVAFAVLERHGQRFLVDFGVANAIAKAAELPAFTSSSALVH